MAVGNAINEQTTGICGFTGTAFTGSPATQYNVQVGGATTSTLTSVAPSATSGVPLISQGAAANPVFGTAAVAGGGTGATSFTAYSVITGGTTSTNPLQNVSGVGTTGQILTSNGAGTLPSWQTAPTPGTFSPNSVVNLFDDFIGVNGTSPIISDIAWTATGTSGGTFVNDVLDNAHPGSIACNMAGTGTNTFRAAQCIILGGGAITLNWVFRIGTLSNGTNRYILRMGLGDTVSTSDQSNGVYFEYVDNVNSGQWQYKTASASTRTTNSSAVTVTTGWHNVQMNINAAANSVSFLVDGVSLGAAITTNIPTTAIAPLFYINGTVGNGAGTTNVYVDLFYMTQVLTIAR